MADKKLVRSANKKIAGVCGGLAEFLGLDASIIRIVWLLCILLGGFGLLAYLTQHPHGAGSSAEEPMPYGACNHRCALLA